MRRTKANTLPIGSWNLKSEFSPQTMKVILASWSVTTDASDSRLTAVVIDKKAFITATFIVAIGVSISLLHLFRTH
jgi:hypothetical protein